ncbi:MAG: Bcr/CflA family efflux MFS transporter [Peptococcaceae bacterium]|nr:Bcr/CflA family efflux MFS transporter [Peptococcaceae bacterium]
MSTINNIEKQKFLGMKGMVFFITLMNMFIPLSTDLYLPALPTMSAYFGVSASLVNLTLVGFFFFFAVGTLICGPFSDKYGRRRVLLVGSALYTATSALCAISPNVYIMIIARILQGIGAGAMIAVSMALIKDCFVGRRRESILAVVQSFSGVAPMIAPVLGAFLLRITSWRGAFVVLTVAGAACFLLSFLYQETLDEEDRVAESTLATLGKLVVVGKNAGFLVPCLIFSLYNVAFMGYIAVSSYIYVDQFGLSAQMYSYFFAANALLSLAGPMIYVKFFSRSDKKKLPLVCFIAYIFCGAALLTVGQLAPAVFWLCFAPFSLLGSLTRPFSSNMLLDQQKGDTGSASSLINGIITVFGSGGMMGITLWANHITGLGTMILAAGILSAIGWILLMRSSVTVVGVKE